MPEQAKIMVVDDTTDNIDLLVEILGEDYDVRVAMDGATALEDMASEPPDLVLLDIMMPGLDGYEVCTRMKADERLSHIPVIFVTAMQGVEDEVRGLDMGAVDYITKPVSPPVVLARVATHLALVKARKDLEEKNRVLAENIRLREEVDRISRHDLKTPLNKIISLPGILIREGQIGEGQEKSLKAIEAAGFTMLEMINRSLDMVRMERGTYDLNPEAVDLHRIAEKIVSDLEARAREKQVSMVVESISGDAALVSGESLLCYSMAANLIKNALEACPEKTSVLIRFFESEDGRVVFSVENQGAVPEAIRDRFFEKYATAGKKEGTGLGTYSARLMAQTMGGEIAMTTSEKAGTCVRVTLPKPAPGIEEETGDTPLPESLPQDLPERSLLLVDDDPDNLRILESYLSHPALHIDLAENGRQAVEKWEALGHGLILMDMEMPVMNGMEAARAIREIEGEAEDRVRMIALSAHDDAMADAFLDAGFDAFLSKPVSRGQLYERLLSCLGLGRRGETPETPAAGQAEEKVPSASEDLAVTVDPDLEEIMPMFLANKAGQIGVLGNQIADMDFQGIRQSAHKLKGGFNMYGITVMGGLCAELEAAAKKEDAEQIRELGREVAGRFGRIDIRFG